MNRSFNFDKIELGLKLNTSEVIERKGTGSRLHCSAKCVRTRGCWSYNFCGGGWCELNQVDEFIKGTSLVGDPLCVYGGMRRETLARCVEGSTPVVVDGRDRDTVCQIEGRGRLTEYTKIAEREEDLELEWRRFESVNCTAGIHVEQALCEVSHQERLVSHLQLVNEPRGFWDAYEYCKSHGGQLFGEVEQRQLVIMLSRSTGAGLWLGISDWETPGVWRNFRGVDVTDLILWAIGQPNNLLSRQHYVALLHTLAQMDDEYPLSRFPFVCQKVFSELTEWANEFESDISVDETKLMQTRKCEKSSDFGPDCEGSVKRVVHFLWMRQPMLWSDANVWCTLSSAMLFYSFDGTQQQADFLFRHMRNESFFVGCFSLTQDTWLNLNLQDPHSLKPSHTIPWSAGERQLAAPVSVLSAQVSNGELKCFAETLRQLPFVCTKIDLLGLISDILSL